MPKSKTSEITDLADDDEDGAPIESGPRVDFDVVEIEFVGVVFLIPKDRGDWSTEATAWLAERKFNLFAKYLLEGVQLGQWRALCALCPRARDFSAFFVLLSRKIREECVGN